MTDYEKWLYDEGCCNENHTPCGSKDCSCEGIYLEINNVKTDVRVVSGEVETKLDASAYTPVDLSDYYTKEEVDNIIPTVPTNVSAFNNDAGYINQLKTINGESLVGEGDIVISGGSGTSITVDDALSTASTNPVQNKVITGALNGKLDASAYTPTDLSNYYTKQQVDNLIPTVPTTVSSFINDAGYLTEHQSLDGLVRNSTFIQYVTNLQEQIDSIISMVSGCCSHSGETLYRWITMTDEDDYWCSGTTKYSLEKKQQSTDGLNWVDVVPEEIRSGSTVLEENSVDCGYVDLSSGLMLQYNSNSGTTQIMNACSSAVTEITIANSPNPVIYYDECRTTVPMMLTSGNTVNIYKSINTVDEDEFRNVTTLEDVGLSSEVVAIGNNAFNGCVNLKRVKLGNYSVLTPSPLPSGQLTSIGDGAFSGCNSLTTIEMYNVRQVPTLGANALPSSLSAIYVPAASANAYKTASGWSAYASIIIGI